MKGKSFKAENREMAFRVYCENGGNKVATILALEKKGLKISRKTLYDWIKEFNFEKRHLEVDKELQNSKDSQLSFEQKMLKDLIKQKIKYETYFASINGIDNQAQFAYSNLIRAIIDIKGKIGADRVAIFIEFLKEFIAYLSKEDPEAVKLVEKNFDDFVAYAREKYAQ